MPQQPPAERPTPQQQQAASRVVPAQPQGQAPRPAPVPSLAGDTLVPLTQMRRAIANNMVQAWSAPHAHAVMPVDVTELMKYREKVRHEFQAREGFDLSPAAFIAKAVVEGVRTVPHVNASWTDQGLILQEGKGTKNDPYRYILPGQTERLMQDPWLLLGLLRPDPPPTS